MKLAVLYIFSFFLVMEGHANTIVYNCIGNQSCWADEFRCPDNINCTINCIGVESCLDANLFCPTNGVCIINCEGKKSCEYMIVHANSSLLLSVTSTEVGSLNDAVIECPHPPQQNTHSCYIHSNNINELEGLTIIALEGFYDVIVSCKHPTLCGAEFATVHCTSIPDNNYCNINVTLNSCIDNSIVGKDCGNYILMNQPTINQTNEPTLTPTTQKEIVTDVASFFRDLHPHVITIIFSCFFVLLCCYACFCLHFYAKYRKLKRENNMNQDIDQDINDKKSDHLTNASTEVHPPSDMPDLPSAMNTPQPQQMKFHFSYKSVESRTHTLSNPRPYKTKSPRSGTGPEIGSRTYSREHPPPLRHMNSVTMTAPIFKNSSQRVLSMSHDDEIDRLELANFESCPARFRHEPNDTIVFAPGSARAKMFTAIDNSFIQDLVNEELPDAPQLECHNTLTGTSIRFIDADEPSDSGGSEGFADSTHTTKPRKSKKKQQAGHVKQIVVEQIDSGDEIAGDQADDQTQQEQEHAMQESMYDSVQIHELEIPRPHHAEQESMYDSELVITPGYQYYTTRPAVKTDVGGVRELNF